MFLFENKDGILVIDHCGCLFPQELWSKMTFPKALKASHSFWTLQSIELFEAVSIHPITRHFLKKNKDVG